MPFSDVDVVGPALSRMGRQLFKPFRFSQWLRLALVGFLAGEMSSGGGCSTNIPSDFPSSRSDQFQAPIWAGRELLFALGVGLAALLVFVLVIGLIYLNSRMRFVLLDSVIDSECRIRRSWNRWGAPAFRYFLWQLVFSLCGLLAIGILVGLPLLTAFSLGWIQNPRDHLVGLVLGGLIFGVLFVSLLATLVVVQVLTKDFVVPQMAFEDVTPVEGWRRLWLMMNSEKGAYAGYVGMKILLSLGAAIAVSIVAIIVFLVLLIPVGGVGVFAVLAGSAAGLTWNPLTIAIAIVAGLIILCGLILIVALISVPSIVFFPAYSLYFFADRYAPLHAVMYPAPPIQNLSPPVP